MKCPECGKEKDSREWFVRGYCDECDTKQKTCEVCGKQAELTAINVVTGKRGHYICVSTDISAAYGTDCRNGCDV